jgi:GH25 family lysozyme M1 (1,4-beta-N-acetylmuramidase)
MLIGSHLNFLTMKWLRHALAIAINALPAVSALALEKRDPIRGIDVSDYQPSISWSSVNSDGNSFAIIMATQGAPGASHGKTFSSHVQHYLNAPTSRVH